MVFRRIRIFWNFPESQGDFSTIGKRPLATVAGGLIFESDKVSRVSMWLKSFSCDLY